MKFVLIVMTVLALLAGAVSACGSGAPPASVVDDLGREIKLDKAPERIVSHVPGITEIIYALGLEERLVGNSEYCDYPEAARSKTKIGGYFDPSVEKIVSLSPDVVLTDGYVEYLAPQLEQLGIPYVVFQPKDIGGIMRNIELLGKLAGVEAKAEQVTGDMRSRLAAVADKVKDAPRPRVFYLVDAADINNPWTAGQGSFIDALLQLAGGENVGASSTVAWAQFSIEQVVDSDPEVLILPAQHGSSTVPIETLKAHPAWSRVSAVKAGRISTVDGDLVSRYGPRIVQGLEDFAKIIHPELFS